jgi:hypothetical protein
MESGKYQKKKKEDGRKKQRIKEEGREAEQKMVRKNKVP